MSSPMTQRLASLAAPAWRAFATSAVARKSATDAVKDGLKTVDRAVSDMVPGMDAAAKVKEGAEKMTKGKAKGAAHEAAGKAKGAAEEVKKKM